jgi:hypothetical protein
VPCEEAGERVDELVETLDADFINPSSSSKKPFFPPHHTTTSRKENKHTQTINPNKPQSIKMETIKVRFFLPQ